MWNKFSSRLKNILFICKKDDLSFKVSRFQDPLTIFLTFKFLRWTISWPLWKPSSTILLISLKVNVYVLLRLTLLKTKADNFVRFLIAKVNRFTHLYLWKKGNNNYDHLIKGQGGTILLINLQLWKPRWTICLSQAMKTKVTVLLTYFDLQVGSFIHIFKS